MPSSRVRAAALVAILIVAPSAPSSAQDAPVPADLPVTRVVAFTSGVGWFEHAGTVTGTQELTLQVPAEHMDDLLQSLVLQDLDGGHVRPVRYPARDPLSRILDSYALDLAGAPTLAELLRQARGEAVRVEAGESLAGTIVGVEEVRPPDDAPRAYLTLLSEGGLRRVALAEIRDVRFESDELRAELAAALDAVARHRDADAAAVRLRFEGEGERRVRVGYVREMPVWKTSYRLVVHEDGSADLQGWAILDNPTDLDLAGVSVSFVAGRPASFVTDLYEPVYVERPRVELDTGPSVVPRADAGAFGPAPAPALRSFADAAEAETAGVAADAVRSLAPSLAGAGVEADAEGAAAGAAFEYRVREPVTIGRHESAMIPIVGRTVPVRQLALHDPAGGGERPLRGVLLTNDTGLHLAAGPVTVVGPAGFAGAARLGGLPDGESRILAHAADPDVRVLQSTESEPQRVVRASLRGGVLESTLRERVRSEYRIEASDGAPPLLVIEHPRRAGFEIVAPAPAPALTEGGARFAVRLDPRGGTAAPAGGADAAGDASPEAGAATLAQLPVQLRCDPDAACILVVVEERTEAQRIEVTSLAPDRVAFLLENVELSDEDREALGRIVRIQDDLAAAERELASRRSRLDAIHREQERIRENMGALARDASLYRRYVSDLEAQEDELAAIHDAVAELEARRAELQDRLDEAVAELP